MSKTRQQNSELRTQTFSVCALCSVLFFLCFGCGGSAVPALPAIQSRAVEYNHSGMKAAENGDYKRALAYYIEALKMNQSIENTEGIAVNLINIGVIYQKLNRNSDAQEYIDMALSIQDASSAVKSEAAYEKARLCLKLNEFVKAREWAVRSLSLNKGSNDCSRFNLLGRISFIEGKYDEVLSHAGTALKLSIDCKQITETANSLRLIADVNMQQGNFEVSRDFYLRALQTDKEAADSKKIALDLLSLGNLFSKRGNFGDAIGYYQRAYRVSKTAGDLRDAADILGLLAAAYEKNGDIKKAEEALKDKKDLEKR